MIGIVAKGYIVVLGVSLSSSMWLQRGALCRIGFLTEAQEGCPRRNVTNPQVFDLIDGFSGKNACDVQLQRPTCGCLNSRQVALLLGCHKVVWSMSKRWISLVLRVVFGPSKVMKRSSGNSVWWSWKNESKRTIIFVGSFNFSQNYVMGFHIFFIVHNQLYPLSVFLFETVSTSARNVIHG